MKIDSGMQLRDSKAYMKRVDFAAVVKVSKERQSANEAPRMRKANLLTTAVRSLSLALFCRHLCRQFHSPLSDCLDICSEAGLGRVAGCPATTAFLSWTVLGKEGTLQPRAVDGRCARGPCWTLTSVGVLYCAPPLQTGIARFLAA